MSNLRVQLGGNTVQVQVQSSGYGAALGSSQTATLAAAAALASQEQADAAAMQADASRGASEIAQAASELAADNAAASLASLIAQKGAANGIASLDSGSKIPVAQIPVGTASGTVAAGDDSRIVGAVSQAALALASGASLVGFVQSGTGAVSETIQAAIRRLGVTPEQFGAAGDLIILTDVAMTSGSGVLTSASAAFVSGDVGKTIKVTGAGASARPLVTTIASRQSATQVTLTATASTSVSGKRAFYGTNDTAAVQKAIDASLLVRMANKYLLAGTITPRAGQAIEMPGCEIVQTTAATPSFKATLAHGLYIDCKGAIIWGHGLFDGNPGGSWTGNSNSEDRGFWFRGCNNIVLRRPRVRDCGQAGIMLEGGTGAYLECPEIEGTHAYSTAIANSLPNYSNFQIGLYIAHTTAYGACEGYTILAPRISNVTQGILDELGVGAARPSVPRSIIAMNVGPIPGQHGAYITDGNLNLINPVVRNTALSGIKVQSGDANPDIRNVIATGADMSDIGSSMFEVQLSGPAGTGSVGSCRFSGQGRNVGNGIALYQKVRDVTADLDLVGVTGAAFQATGDDVTGFDITVRAKDVGGSAINISATNCSGRVRPTLTGAQNSSNTAGASGVRVTSASTTIEVLDPNIAPSSGNMKQAIFNEVAGSTITVRGSAKLRGATDYTVRSTGGLTVLPAQGDYQAGASGLYLGVSNISFVGEPVFTATSSGSTTVLRSATAPATGAFVVEALLVAKKSDNTQQKATMLRRAFAFDGTTVTAVAATQETVIGASGTFDGTYSLNAGTGGTTGATTYNVLVSNTGGSFNWTLQERVLSA